MLSATVGPHGARFAAPYTGPMRLPLLCLLAALAPAAAAQRASHAAPALRPASTASHEDTLEAGDDTLTSGEFSDAWTLEVAAGQELTVEVVSDAFDPYVILKPPSGAPGSEQLDNDDWNGSRRVARIVQPNAAAGTWTLLATSYSVGETGRYTATLSAAYPSDSLTSARTRAGLAGTTWAEDCPGADPSRTFIRLDADGQFAWSGTSATGVARDGGDTWAVEDGRLVVRWNDSYAVSRYGLDGGGILSGTSSKSCGSNIRLLRMP